MKIFFVFIFLLICSGAFADVRTPTAQESAGTNTDARRIANKIYDTFSNTSCANPGNDFIRRACKLNKDTSRALILWNVSQDILFSYYDELHTRMTEIGRATNRTVKHETDTDEYDGISEKLWLDRGDLDLEKCNWDFAARRACDYPDGFENFSVDLYDSNPYMSKEQTTIVMNVQIDSPNENKVNSISIDFNAYDSDRTMGVSVIVSGTEYKYDEFYNWQNQTAQDIRDGMYVKVPKKKGRQPKGSPFPDIEWQMDDSREWQSQKIPDAVVFMQTIDANLSVSGGNFE